MNVIALRNVEPESSIDPAIERMTDLIVKTREAILDEKKAVKKSKAKRLESGQHLLDLRQHIEQHPELLTKQSSWWEFFEFYFLEFCSRSDAEKRMAMAASDDPEGALAEERRKRREGMARARADKEPAHISHVGGNDIEEYQSVRKEACEQTGLSQPMVAQKSDDTVVSLNVRRALEAILNLTPNERGHLATLLRERNVSL